ncbi:alpha/beta hydrolase [Dyadobacter luteus]|nr:alpha/beta fold hydrolase [Dyadobacter luteus]
MRATWIFVLLLQALTGLTIIYVKTEEKRKNDNIASMETTQTNLQYLIKEPEKKGIKGKAIILLHGVGSNEKDLFTLADYLPEDFYIISVRAPFPMGAERYAWYQVDFSTGKPVYNTQQEQQSRKMIQDFIVQVKQKYDLEQVYLGGFSQGAIMSFSIGLTDPGSVKGIVALSGRLLEEIKPFAAQKDELKKLQVFIAHGKQDRTLDVAYAREAKTYLHQLGIEPTYSEFEGGHQVTADVIQELKIWLQ